MHKYTEFGSEVVIPFKIISDPEQIFKHIKTLNDKQLTPTDINNILDIFSFYDQKEISSSYYYTIIPLY